MREKDARNFFFDGRGTGGVGAYCKTVSEKTGVIFSYNAATVRVYREMGISSESISFCSFLIALGSFIES